MQRLFVFVFYILAIIVFVNQGCRQSNVSSLNATTLSTLRFESALRSLKNQLRECKSLYEQCKSNGRNHVRTIRDTEREQEQRCTETIGLLATGQKKLEAMLEEKSAQLQKECSKPKLCFNQFAVMLSNGAFFFNAESMTWPAAREFCQSKGMDLVAIESDDENKLIAANGRALGAPFTSMNAWTSGCFSSQRGSWFWHSTEKNLTYDKWWREHGTKYRYDDHCIVLDSSDSTFLTGNMTESRPFICELL